MDEGIKVRRDQTEREIADLKRSVQEARSGFQEDIESLKKEILTPLIKDMREVRDSMLYAKGGWKVLIALGGFGAAVGALLAKVPWENLLPHKWGN